MQKSTHTMQGATITSRGNNIRPSFRMRCLVVVSLLLPNAGLLTLLALVSSLLLLALQLSFVQGFQGLPP